MLSDAELGQLWQAVAEAVTIPVIAGTGTNDTRHTIECTKLATAAGVDAAARRDAVLHRGPPSTGWPTTSVPWPTATALPVMLYDIPVRAGRRIARDTMLRPGPRRAQHRRRERRRRRPRRLGPARRPRPPTGSRSTAATTP